MKMRIKEIGPADGFFGRQDLIGKVGEWEQETQSLCSDGGWKSGYMRSDNPIDDAKCWYFIQVRVVPLDTDSSAYICHRDEPATVSFRPSENMRKCIETIPLDTKPIGRHGHPNFYRLCEEEMDLHSRKNHDYACGGNPLGNFNRVSAILAMYPGLKLSDPAVVAITYMLKQLDASLWMLSNGHTAKVEGQEERWQDISVYSKIISILISEGGKDVKNN